MNFIYILPFKSQNVTNFTFWKILLEIHEVHLIQGNQFLVPPAGWTRSLQFPKMKVLFKFSLNLDQDDLNPGRSEWTRSKHYSEEADLNSWALSSNSTFEKVTLPRRAPVLLVTRQSQFLLVGRERPTAVGHRPQALSLATSATDQKKFPIRLERSDMKKQT